MRTKVDGRGEGAICVPATEAVTIHKRTCRPTTGARRRWRGLRKIVRLWVGMFGLGNDWDASEVRE